MKNFLIAIIIVAVLGGGYMLWQGSSKEPAETTTTDPFPTSETIVPTPAPSPTPTTPSPTPATPTPPTATPTPSPAAAPMSATVTFDGKTFSPASVTIAKGGTVNWVNGSSIKMWVASDVHPSHMEYAGTSRQVHCPDTSGTAFDQCTGDGNYSFTFDKAGTWEYHDHLTPSATGKIIVK